MLSQSSGVRRTLTPLALALLDPTEARHHSACIWRSRQITHSQQTPSVGCGKGPRIALDDRCCGTLTCSNMLATRPDLAGRVCHSSKITAQVVIQAISPPMKGNLVHCAVLQYCAPHSTLSLRLLKAHRLPFPGGGLLEAAKLRCTFSTIALAALMILMLLPVAEREAAPPLRPTWLRATLLLTRAPQSCPAAAAAGPLGGIGVTGGGGSAATAAAMFVHLSWRVALKACAMRQSPALSWFSSTCR